ncbi:MAG: 16S rRNA processing protein RimM [Clostridia bacterium]|nr:16S rRNA processing protein RimM [Clostridia bacterium]
MVDYFEIGHISNTHGLKGELKVRPFTKSKKDYEKLKSILVDFNGTLKEYQIDTVRYQQDIVLLKLKEVNDIDEALKLKGKYIRIPREAAKETAENEFFIADLIGCEVYQEELIGVVDDVFTSGAADVYVVKRKGKKDLLLPTIASVVKKIDVKLRRIDVEIPRGLEDEV